jgi:hypothetical protein
MSYLWKYRHVFEIYRNNKHLKYTEFALDAALTSSIVARKDFIKYRLTDFFIYGHD